MKKLSKRLRLKSKAPIDVPMNTTTTKTLTAKSYYLALVTIVGIVAMFPMFLMNSGRLEPSTERFSTMNDHPSFTEYQGFYNMTSANYYGDDAPPHVDQSQFLQTVDNLPTLTWRELNDISGAIYQCLAQCPPPHARTKKEIDQYYRDCVVAELKDRTARVEMPDYRLLTLPMVRALQNEVLAARPLWRIMIVSESPETVIMIYPRTVRIANYDTERDLGKVLAETVAKAQELRDLREGPYRRQIEYLKLPTKKAVDGWKTESFRAIAAFDNYKGQPGELTVWILHPSNSYVSIEEPTAAARSSACPVRADGSIGEPFDDSIPAPYQLTPLILPADAYAGELLVEIEFDYDGNVHGTRIPILPIIRDAELMSQRSNRQ